MKIVAGNIKQLFITCGFLCINHVGAAVQQVVQQYDELALCKSLEQTIAKQEKHFVIIVPSFNNKDWYIKNLSSIFEQTYKNYSVIYLDDASSDGTAQLVEQYVHEQGKAEHVKIISNKERVGGLGNIYNAVHQSADTSIAIELDGDDWFAHNRVLEVLNKVYQDPNIWLTYGQFKMYPTNQYGWELGYKQIEQSVINNGNYRASEWTSSALRTWYVWLFKRIKKEDLLYQNKFYMMTWDQAFMLPMLEMAGRHSYFIPDILYIYNIDNVRNDFKVNAWMQGYLRGVIRSKKQYIGLSSAFVPPHCSMT